MQGALVRKHHRRARVNDTRLPVAGFMAPTTLQTGTAVCWVVCVAQARRTDAQPKFACLTTGASLLAPVSAWPSGIALNMRPAC